jgi:hypothetical protein
VLSELVFRLWHAYRGGTLDRASLQLGMEAIQLPRQALLESGKRRYDAASGRGHELLTRWEALWTSVREERASRRTIYSAVPPIPVRKRLKALLY